jgi:hypothetical protein
MNDGIRKEMNSSSGFDSKVYIFGNIIVITLLLIFLIR